MGFARGELEVSRWVIRVPGGPAEKSTKTDRARPVALDEVGITLLTEYRARVEAPARAAGAVITGDAYVFSPYVDATNPFRPDNVTGFFVRVRDSLGLHEVRLHDLRPFTATQLIGVDVRAVAERLGHSDASLTLRVYSHAIRARERAAAEVIGRRYAGPARRRESPAGPAAPTAGSTGHPDAGSAA